MLAVNYYIHVCLMPNIARIIIIYLISILLLDMPTYFVLVMQCAISLMNIVLELFE